MVEKKESNYNLYVVLVVAVVAVVGIFGMTGLSSDLGNDLTGNAIKALVGSSNCKDLGDRVRFTFNDRNYGRADSCDVSTSQLTDWSCKPNGRAAREIVECEYGCRSTSCAEAPETEYFCETLSKGSVTNWTEYDGEVVASDTFESTCVGYGERTSIRYYCDALGNVVNEQETCEYGCSDGVCLQESDLYCQTFDGGVYNITGSRNLTIENYCSRNYQYIFNCDGDTESYGPQWSVDSERQYCPYGCNGDYTACANPTCEELGNGSILENGTTVTNPTCTSYNHSLLVNFGCDNEGIYPESELEYCDYGCQDGECLPEPTGSCCLSSAQAYYNYTCSGEFTWAQPGTHAADLSDPNYVNFRNQCNSNRDYAVYGDEVYANGYASNRGLYDGTCSESSQNLANTLVDNFTTITLSSPCVQILANSCNGTLSGPSTATSTNQVEFEYGSQQYEWYCS